MLGLRSFVKLAFEPSFIDDRYPDNFVCMVAWAMEEVPDFTIPIILSCLETRDVCRCACIGNVWNSAVHQMLGDIFQRSARAREQVCEDANLNVV